MIEKQESQTISTPKHSATKMQSSFYQYPLNKRGSYTSPSERGASMTESTLDLYQTKTMTASQLKNSRVDSTHPLKLANLNSTTGSFKGGLQYQRKLISEEAFQQKQRNIFMTSQTINAKESKKNILLRPAHPVSGSTNPPTFFRPSTSQSTTSATAAAGGTTTIPGTAAANHRPSHQFRPPTIQPVISDSAQAKIEMMRRQKRESDFNEIIKSSIDQELQYFRFNNSKIIESERLCNIQTFIFNKKSQNRLKYSERSKINTTALPVPQGSVSVMLNVQKKDYGFNLNNFKKKIPAKSKFKMKWKTIQWLLANKTTAIKQLFSNYSLMLKFAKNKKGGMNRIEFGELLSYVGLGAEQNLGDKLFYIFDDDGSGTVDYKELIVGLEMFKENSVDDKLKVFVELCEIDDQERIGMTEIYSILKQNLFNQDDKTKLKGMLREIYKAGGGGDLMEKGQLLKATTTHHNLLALLDESVRNVKRVDQLIENDLEEPFHCSVPISANFINYKEGIHFGLVEKLLKVVSSVEDGYQFRKDTRSKYKSALNLGKNQRELQILKEDSLNQSDADEND